MDITPHPPSITNFCVSLVSTYSVLFHSERERDPILLHQHPSKYAKHQKHIKQRSKNFHFHWKSKSKPALLSWLLQHLPSVGISIFVRRNLGLCLLTSCSTTNYCHGPDEESMDLVAILKSPWLLATDHFVAKKSSKNLLSSSLLFRASFSYLPGSPHSSTHCVCKLEQLQPLLVPRLPTWKPDNRTIFLTYQTESLTILSNENGNSLSGCFPRDSPRSHKALQNSENLSWNWGLGNFPKDFISMCFRNTLSVFIV